MRFYNRQYQFDVVASTYSAEFASKLHERQLTAVFYSILTRQKRQLAEDRRKKQKFYENSQLSLFV